jgi:FkbM family methyltransferase
VSTHTRLSVIVLTHQFADLVARAIDSALALEHPADALEVIVVDDGSTDATPAVLAAYGDRITVLRHENIGSAASLERGALAATGDVLVFMDGDDVLYPALAPRVLARFAADPGVGLVSVDRRVVGPQGQVVAPSFDASVQLDKRSGRPLGALLSRNVVTLSGTAVRRDLLPAVLPIPPDAPAEDWWLAVNVARVADLSFVAEPLVDYVFHGGNRNLGSPDAKTVRLVRRDLRFRAWMLRELWCSPLVTAHDLVAAAHELAKQVVVVEGIEPGTTAPLLAPGADAERMRDVYLRRTAAATSADERVRAAAAALGWAPLDPAARAAFGQAHAALTAAPAPAPAPAGPAAPAGLTTIALKAGGNLAVPAERLWAFQGGRYYETSVSHWLGRLMAATDAPVLYDIGSNIGYYAVEHGPTAGHVYAFEPVANTHAILNENIRINGLQDTVTPVPMGLSDADGTAEIHLWSSSGSNTLFAREFGEAHPHKEIGTETITLGHVDGLVAEGRLRPPHVMKVDIEGAELPALRGARETLRAHLPHLVVECEADACTDAGYTPEELYDELRALDYALVGLSRDPSDLRLHPLAGREGVTSNLVAFPPGSPLLRELLAEAIGDVVRGSVVVVALEDALTHPELLRDHADRHDADSDVTLVIFGPGQDALLNERLPKLVGDLGLDGADAPDMLGVTGTEPTLAALLDVAGVALQPSAALPAR